MKTSWLLLLMIPVTMLLQSCFISRQPGYDLRNLDRQEVYALRTIQLPMFLARTAVKLHLKDEDYPKELRSYVNRIHQLQVTVAATRPDFSLNNFAAMATAAPYQNWVSINARGNRVLINAAEKNNRIRRINIAVASENNGLVYAVLKCKLSPDELSTLINILLSDEKRLTGIINKIHNDPAGKEL